MCAAIPMMSLGTAYNYTTIVPSFNSKQCWWPLRDNGHSQKLARGEICTRQGTAGHVLGLTMTFHRYITRNKFMQEYCNPILAVQRDGCFVSGGGGRELQPHDLSMYLPVFNLQGRSSSATFESYLIQSRLAQ